MLFLSNICFAQDEFPLLDSKNPHLQQIIQEKIELLEKADQSFKEENPGSKSLLETIDEMLEAGDPEALNKYLELEQRANQIFFETRPNSKSFLETIDEILEGADEELTEILLQLKNEFQEIESYLEGFLEQNKTIYHECLKALQDSSHSRFVFPQEYKDCQTQTFKNAMLPFCKYESDFILKKNQSSELIWEELQIALEIEKDKQEARTSRIIGEVNELFKEHSGNIPVYDPEIDLCEDFSL